MIYQVDLMFARAMIYNRGVMGKREFAEWLEGKFLSWMGEAGRRRTVTEFAKYLGVSQSLMSQWLNGHYLPDLKISPRSPSGWGLRFMIF